MKLRTKDTHTLCSSSSFNPIGWEIIVYFEDGDCSSDYIHEYDVEIDGKWKPLEDAFRDRDLITDNHNLHFGPPRNEEERERGYFL